MGRDGHTIDILYRAKGAVDPGVNATLYCEIGPP